MIYWIKKSITKYYKEKMKERTVEIQQEQIKQQDEKIKNLQTEKARLVPVSCAQSHAVSTRYAGLPDHPKRDTILPCREDGDCISFG